MFFRSTLIFVICGASCFRDTSAVKCGTVADCVAEQGVCDTDNGICWCNTGYHGAGCATACDAGCTSGICGPNPDDCIEPTAICPTTACGSEGTCTAYDDGATPPIPVKCKCNSEFAGPACDADCSALMCTIYQMCTSVDESTPICTCKNGLGSGDCTTVDCTLGDPCLYGTCDTATCTCDATHTGIICQHACPTDALACDDVFNTCETKLDDTGAECVCKTGLTEPDCTVDCSGVSPCLNGGTCNAVTEPDTCDCDSTHTGDICQLVACFDGKACLNGGTCVESACNCNTTMAAGDHCQFACTNGCTGGETCKENAGVGECSGGATVLASAALIVAAAFRHFF